MSPNSMGFAADFTVILAPGAHNVFTNKGSTVYYHEIKMFAQVFFLNIAISILFQFLAK